MKNKNLIIIPFAYLKEYNGGVNIKDENKKLDTYLKNCCVSCVSAKKNAGMDTDVALVSNFEIPNNFKNILNSSGVQIIKADFNQFNFDGKYAWSLAFFKLNALFYVVKEFEYDNYAYLDSDVFIQGNFNYIWIECSRKIMMYDICHGLQIEDYRNFIKETSAFLGHDTLGLTHYGGEFFAANRENTLSFIDECLKIYNRMISISFNAKSGDEFISSLAADCLSEKVRNAGAYVYRFWTRRFHLMSTNYQYNSVIVLHVPQEKDYGMKKIFDNYVAKGTLPSRKKVWRLLHLSRTDWKIALYLKLQSLKG